MKQTKSEIKTRISELSKLIDDPLISKFVKINLINKIEELSKTLKKENVKSSDEN